jgi:tetratricopeptide (TPR) repeat protein
MSDWFRKNTWTDDDRDDFEKRLRRARRSSRGQYLRIQATHLADAGHNAAALGLLERMLAEYPDQVQRAQAQLQQAQCYICMGQHSDAVRAFREALDAERKFPQVRTRAKFEFPLFVAMTRMHEAFAEALQVTNEAECEIALPRDRFELAAARSLIARTLQDHQSAKAHALAALAAASEARSAFAHHPTVGLVPEDHALIPELRRIGDGIQ